MSGLISSFQDTNVASTLQEERRVFIARSRPMCHFFYYYSPGNTARCFGCITEKPAAMGLGLIQGNNLITFTHTAYYGAALPCVYFYDPFFCRPKLKQNKD